MNDERRTPLWLFKALDKKFEFTIDLAASKENALVSTYYTKEDNALIKTWEGEVAWCNPPYSVGNLHLLDIGVVL